MAMQESYSCDSSYFDNENKPAGSTATVVPNQHTMAAGQTAE
jgi:hypothetical protein